MAASSKPTGVHYALVVFVLITVIGVAYVGARYARLDRFFVDDSYAVVAHFADSGGAFAGAEVSYRGVRVGRVEPAEVTRLAVVVDDDVAIEIFQVHGVQPRSLRACSSAATSRSISPNVL